MRRHFYSSHQLPFKNGPQAYPNNDSLLKLRDYLLAERASSQEPGVPGVRSQDMSGTTIHQEPGDQTRGLARRTADACDSTNRELSQPSFSKSIFAAMMKSLSDNPSILWVHRVISAFPQASKISG
jgi:hypothetical protein